MRPTEILALAVGIPWVIVGIRLLETHEGRAYLRARGSQQAIAESLAEREMGLVFVGLVLAALAFTSSPASSPHETGSELLATALAAATTSWVVSNFAGVAWSSFLSAGLLLVALAAVVLSVGEFIGGEPAHGVVAITTIGIAFTVVFGYSIWLAALHHVAAMAVARRSTISTEPPTASR